MAYGIWVHYIGTSLYVDDRDDIFCCLEAMLTNFYITLQLVLHFLKSEMHELLFKYFKILKASLKLSLKRFNVSPPLE